MARLGRSFPFQPNLGGESPVLRKPTGLSPLAKSTTPGQLTTRVTLVAARTAREQPRRFPLQGWDGTVAQETGFSTTGVRGGPNRNLGVRPPRVILALPPQRSQTIGVALAAVRTARQNASSQRFPLQGWDGALIRETGFSTTTFRGTPNRNLGPRPPRVISALPPQLLQTVGVSLVAVRTRREWTRHFWRQEFSGSVTKEQGTTTTRGVLERVIGVDAPEVILPLPTLAMQTVRCTLVAIRRRVERNRREFPSSFLAPPQVVSVTPSQEQQTVSVALVAARSRGECQRHFPLQGWDGTLVRETRPGGIDPAGSFGYSSSDTGTQIGSGGDAKIAVSVLATEPLAVTELHAVVKVNVATGNARMGVYADLNGAPGALLASSQTVVLGSSLADVTFTLSAPLLLSIGKTYWLAVQVDAAFTLAANLSFGRRDTGTADSFTDGLSDPYGAASLGKGNPFIYAVGTVPNGVALLSRNLGPKPPGIQDPLPAQRLQTVETTLSVVRSRFDPRRASHTFLAAPTAVTTFTAEPVFVALARIRPAKTTTSLSEPTVIRVPAVEQREDTIAVTLAGRARLEWQRHYTQHVLSPPSVVSPLAARQTLMAAFAVRRRLELAQRAPHSTLRAPAPYTFPLAQPTTPGQLTTRVTLAGRTRREVQRLRTTYRLAPPTLTRVPSVEQREDTISVTLAGRTRLEERRRRVESVLGPARYLSPLAKSTTPGQLTDRETLVAVRTRTEQSRHASNWKLAAPTKVIPPPTLREQSVQVTLAGRTRTEIPRHASHWKLTLPTKVVPLTTQRQQTLTIWLAGRTAGEATRHAPHSTLRPPTRVIPLPSLEQQTVTVALARIRPPKTAATLRKPLVLARAEDTILVSLAAHPRFARAPHSHLAQPIALRVFAGPETQLAVIRPPQTGSKLAPPTVLRVPSVEQAEDTVRVALAPSPRQPRASRSRLAPPTVLRVPSVEQAEDTIRVSLAPAPRQPRAPHSRLAPPTVTRPAVDTIRFTLASAPRNARQPHSRLAPPTVVTRPAPRTEHVAVALVDVVDRVPSRLRKTRSRLAPPTVILVPVPPVAPTGGIGGSGMSDDEYERLLRRLGALPKELGLSDLDLEDAVYVLRMLGFIE